MTLKACPFCGLLPAAAIYYPALRMYVVECPTQGCEIEGPGGDTAEEAERRWNTRAVVGDEVSTKLIMLAADVSDLAESLRSLADTE